MTYKEVTGYGKVHVPARVLPVAQGRHVPVGKVPVSGAVNKSCRYCGRIHRMGQECQHKQVRAKQRTEASSFRSTNAWTRKSRQIRERDHGLCRLCLEEGQLKWEDVQVHHIVPVEEDWELRLEDDNLISLCGEHHREAERTGERDRLRRLAREAPPSPGEGKAWFRGRCKTTQPG